MVGTGFLYNPKESRSMSEPENSLSKPVNEKSPRIAVASNGNMVGLRGGTFSTRRAIFMEAQAEEKIIDYSNRNSEEE